MKIRLAQFTAIAFSFAAALFAVPVQAAGNVPYTFHVPVQLTTINADTNRIPVTAVDVACNISSTSAMDASFYGPVDSVTGLPTGGNTSAYRGAVTTLQIPASGTINQTLTLVVNGTANEKYWSCGLMFHLAYAPFAGANPNIVYSASLLNRNEGTSGGAPVNQPVVKAPAKFTPDPGYPFDGTSLNTSVSGTF
jgi:hypothetical protein